MLRRNATVKPFLVSLVEPVAYLKSELADFNRLIGQPGSRYLSRSNEPTPGTPHPASTCRRRYRKVLACICRRLNNLAGNREPYGGGVEQQTHTGKWNIPGPLRSTRGTKETRFTGEGLKVVPGVNINTR